MAKQYNPNDTAIKYGIWMFEWEGWMNKDLEAKDTPGDALQFDTARAAEEYLEKEKILMDNPESSIHNCGVMPTCTDINISHRKCQVCGLTRNEHLPFTLCTED